MIGKASILLFLTVVFGTPLDDYVNKPDPSYSYFDTGLVINFPYAKGYILNMTSQTWLTSKDVDRSTWWHTLVVVVPNKLLHKDYAFLWITGGSSNDGYPKDGNSEDLILSSTIASSTGTIVAALLTIPNEPIVFASDPTHSSRNEDDAIAYTWEKYMNDTSLVEWPLQLPMVKSAVKAMDTVESYTKSNASISKWLIAGASKRGWTTWLVGAVDKRVKAMVPIVMDLLNIQTNLHHMYRILGGWTFAFKDYYNHHLTANLDSPNLTKLAAIVDPYNYKERFVNLPKLVIDSADDEFFAIDDNYYWWNQMVGETHLLLAQNAEHTLITALPEVVECVIAFVTSFIRNEEARPSFTWSFEYKNITDGLINIKVAPGSPKPTRVVVRHATTISHVRRDFRWATAPINDQCPEGTFPVKSICVQPILWQGFEIQPIQPDVYQATIPSPSKGWSAFFVELYFKSLTVVEYRFTTQAMVLPNTFPFPACHGSECKGTLV